MLDGAFALGPVKTYSLDQIRDAHHAVETNTVSGKVVVLTASGIEADRSEES